MSDLTTPRKVTAPLTYAGRCERYARQRGWAYDEHAMSVHHLTPAQRRRAMHKEQRQYRDAPDVVRARRQRARQYEQHAALNRKRHAAGWDDYDYGWDDYDGHSPADEYLIYPRDDSPSYGDSFAY